MAEHTSSAGDGSELAAMLRVANAAAASYADTLNALAAAASRQANAYAQVLARLANQPLPPAATPVAEASESKKSKKTHKHSESESSKKEKKRKREAEGEGGGKGGAGDEEPPAKRPRGRAHIIPPRERFAGFKIAEYVADADVAAFAHANDQMMRFGGVVLRKTQFAWLPLEIVRAVARDPALAAPVDDASVNCKDFDFAKAVLLRASSKYHPTVFGYAPHDVNIREASRLVLNSIAPLSSAMGYQHTAFLGLPKINYAPRNVADRRALAAVERELLRESIPRGDYVTYCVIAYVGVIGKQAPETVDSLCVSLDPGSHRAFDEYDNVIAPGGPLHAEYKEHAVSVNLAVGDMAVFDGRAWYSVVPGMANQVWLSFMVIGTKEQFEVDNCMFKHYRDSLAMSLHTMRPAHGPCSDFAQIYQTKASLKDVKAGGFVDQANNKMASGLLCDAPEGAAVPLVPVKTLPPLASLVDTVPSYYRPYTPAELACYGVSIVGKDGKQTAYGRLLAEQNPPGSQPMDTDVPEPVLVPSLVSLMPRALVGDAPVAPLGGHETPALAAVAMHTSSADGDAASGNGDEGEGEGEGDEEDADLVAELPPGTQMIDVYADNELFDASQGGIGFASVACPIGFATPVQTDSDAGASLPSTTGKLLELVAISDEDDDDEE